MDTAHPRITPDLARAWTVARRSAAGYHLRTMNISRATYYYAYYATPTGGGGRRARM
jgi:hypothetical protein